MDNIIIQPAEIEEIREAAQVLSFAMIDNPIHLAVYQGKGEKERADTENAFFAVLTERPSKIFLAKSADRIIGVMRMRPCSGSKVSEDNSVIDSFAFRKFQWLNEWARHDPKYPHWHFGPLGVLPEYQKKGAGAKLMRRGCEEADALQAIAYLETDRERNVGFYRKFGFEVVDESMILEVKNTYMKRDPKL